MFCWRGTFAPVGPARWKSLKGVQGGVPRPQIPEDENIMICIAMGYPDDSFPANHVRSVRADNSEFVQYKGF